MAKTKRFVPKQTKGLKKRVAKLETAVKKGRAEIKASEHERENIAVLSTTTTGWVQLTSIPEGANAGERIGRQVRLWRIIGRVNMEFNAILGGIQRYRLMIVKDMDPDSAAVFPALNTLVQYYVSGVPKTTSLLNYNNRRRFKIMWDRTGVLNSNAGSSIPQKHYKINMNLKGQLQDFVGVGATSTSKRDLYFVAYSDAIANGPVLNCQFRTFYSDA